MNAKRVRMTDESRESKSREPREPPKIKPEAVRKGREVGAETPFQKPMLVNVLGIEIEWPRSHDKPSKDTPSKAENGPQEIQDAGGSPSSERKSDG